MKKLVELAQDSFKIPYECIAEILDNNDTKDRGRLKVKIQGITEMSSIFPWAETQGSLFGSDNSTIGVSSVPKIGTLVYVKFLYGNPSFPIVTGYVRGNKDSSLLHTVKELNSTISGTRTDNLIGPELPPLNSSSIYPFNNVIETETCVIEIDDTSSNKRISIQHKNGSYIEIRPNGDIQVKSTNNEYHIIKGDIQEYVEGLVNTKIKETLDYDVDGNITIKSGATIKLDASDIIFTASTINMVKK